MNPVLMTCFPLSLAVCWWAAAAAAGVQSTYHAPVYHSLEKALADCPHLGGVWVATPTPTHKATLSLAIKVTTAVRHDMEHRGLRMAGTGGLLRSRSRCCNRVVRYR